MLTAPKLTDRDREGLALLAEHYAIATRDRTDTYLRVSNVTRRTDDPAGPCLYWQTADRLAAAGVAEKRRDLARLNADGALLVLASLAGWEIPADIGDPFVVDVCVKAAKERGQAADWPDDVIDMRIDPLVALIYPNHNA